MGPRLPPAVGAGGTGHGLTLPSRKAAFDLARPAKPDDVLDALVAAWTARRVVAGEAKRLPAVPETDAAGLRVEIVC